VYAKITGAAITHALTVRQREFCGIVYSPDQTTLAPISLIISFSSTARMNFLR